MAGQPDTKVHSRASTIPGICVATRAEKALLAVSAAATSQVCAARANCNTYTSMPCSNILHQAETSPKQQMSVIDAWALHVCFYRLPACSSVIMLSAALLLQNTAQPYTTGSTGKDGRAFWDALTAVEPLTGPGETGLATEADRCRCAIDSLGGAPSSLARWNSKYTCS